MPDNDIQKRKDKAWPCACVASRCLLCIVVSILLILLVLSVAFVALGIPLGKKPGTLIDGLAIVYSHWLLPLFALAGEMLKALSPWGIIFLVGLSVILWGPNWIRQAIISSKWEFGGVKRAGPGNLHRTISGVSA